ncbi:DEAD/DEAH box helicase [Ceratobasidium sp. AG-Ba]|nr:DEAD/DEAH box helicase [Ceratobasidium sp. AG-Ba]
MADPQTLLRAIRGAFPHVKNPTAIQAELIPAIHRGEDVILMDETGSGKTFGSVLALLSDTQQSHLGITTLYIVPHRELAYQIEHWCKQLLAEGSSAETIASHVQVLARPNVDSTLASIKKNPPRILIATPGALIDGMLHSRHPLKLHLSLQRIVVDEVDVVMKLWDRYRQPRQPNRHYPEAAQAIDRILDDIWRLKRPKPQMVMMSATLWIHVRAWLFAQKGWMAEQVVRLNGIKTRQGEEEDFVSSSNRKFVHSAIAVEPDGTLRDMCSLNGEEGTTAASERGILSHKPGLILEALSGEEGTPSKSPTSSCEVLDEYAAPRPPTDRSFSEITIPPSIFEAIATSVALDVTKRAMCVLPAGSPVIPIVQEFRKLGVDARLLNLGKDIRHISRPTEENELLSTPSHDGTPRVDNDGDQPGHLADKTSKPMEESSHNPTLLVTTTKSVRGLDIPTLSHVYIVGVWIRLQYIDTLLAALVVSVCTGRLCHLLMPRVREMLSEAGLESAGSETISDRLMQALFRLDTSIFASLNDDWQGAQTQEKAQSCQFHSEIL